MIFAFLIFVLTSCRENGIVNTKSSPLHFSAFREMTMALDTNAQGVFDGLQAMTADSCRWTILDKNEYELLCAEAAFKSGDYHLNNIDPFPIVSFYDSISAHTEDHELEYLKARSHYYLGISMRNKENSVEAVKNFLIAIETMTEKLPQDNDYSHTRFKALAYTRLGETLYNEALLNASLSCFEQAKDLFSEVGDNNSVGFMYRNIGRIQQANKEYDKAIGTFKLAEHLLSGHYPMQTAHAIGGLFYNQRQYDSAAVYLEQSFNTNYDHLARLDAAAKLAEIYGFRGDKNKEDFYTAFYVRHSIQEANKASSKMEIAYLYDSYNLKNTQTEDKTPNHNKTTIILITAFISIGVITTISVNRYNKRQLKQIEDQINNIEAQHKKETHGKNKEIKNISKQLAVAQRKLTLKDSTKTFEQRWEEFIKSPIYIHIHKLVDGKDIMIKNSGEYAHLKLSTKHILDLVKTTNTIFEDFTIQLLNDFPNLGTNDARHCCFTLLGISDVEIAVLTGRSYSGINRTTNKILTSMHSNENLEQTLFLYLKSLFGKD